MLCMFFVFFFFLAISDLTAVCTILCTRPRIDLWIYYPLANEVAKGYSNATVRPSFRNILVNTLESTSFNGF